MREGLWLALAAVAWLSPRGRPLTLLLVVCAAYTYACVYAGLPALGGYHASIWLDALSLGVGLLILRTWGMHEWWARAVVGLYVPTLTLQLVWAATGSHEQLGMVCYHVGVWTFTLQLAVLAFVGTLEIREPSIRVG